MKRRYLLRCRDPRPFRSSRRRVSQFFAEHSDPSLSAALIVELAVSMIIDWPHQYGVAFPHDRAEWDVVSITKTAAL